MHAKAKKGKARRPAAESIEPTNAAPADAAARALRGRLASERAREQKSDAASVAARLAKLREVARRFDALPILDDREPDEILGYDENGLPT
jgi:antitoxin VapB